METNPFRNQASSIIENGEGKIRIPFEIIDKLIDAAPTIQWKLLIALWRYAGLRKMEPMELTRDDVLWEEGKLRVRSPKTKHHAGKSVRFVPIRDVAVYLRDAVRQAEEGDGRLISQNRVTISTLHKRFTQMIKKVGLRPWPNLIKNLRLSCENDWIDNREAPDHVIAAWIGHSVQVQRSDYALVSAGHFDGFNSRPARHSKSGSDSGSDAVGNGENSREMAQMAAHLNHTKNAADQCFSNRNATEARLFEKPGFRKKGGASHRAGMVTRPNGNADRSAEESIDSGGGSQAVRSAGQQVTRVLRNGIRTIPPAQGNRPIAGWNRCPRCVSRGDSPQHAGAASMFGQDDSSAEAGSPP